MLIQTNLNFKKRLKALFLWHLLKINIIYNYDESENKNLFVIKIEWEKKGNERMEKVTVNVLRFLKMIQELASLSENGIKPFEEATKENFENYVFYDSSTEEQYEDDLSFEDCLRYKVANMVIIDENKRKIVTYYDNYVEEDYDVYVCINSEDEKIIQIHLNDELEQIITIENGKWDFNL